MTPDPAAVAALRVMACPWIAARAAVCVPAASKEHPCNSGPDRAHEATQAMEA